MKHPTVDFYKKIQKDLKKGLKISEIVKKYEKFKITRYVFKKFYENPNNIEAVKVAEKMNYPDSFHKNHKENALKNDEQRELKEKFIEEFPKKLGFVSLICKEMGIKRRLYYYWLEKDEEFKKEVEILKDEMKQFKLDITESKLMSEIQNENFPAMKYFLDTHGANRGYGEGAKELENSNDEQEEFFDSVAVKQMEKEGFILDD